MKKLVSTLLATTMAIGSAPTLATADTNPFLGTIQAFGTNFCPRGWARADGGLLPIATNTALFSLLGTTYGGDGRTTFGLPDLTGRADMGEGNGPGLTSRRQGEKGGNANVTETISTMASHTHAVQGSITANIDASRVGPDTGSPADAYVPTFAAPNAIYATASDPLVEMGANSVAFTNEVTLQNTGGGQPVNNMQPYLAMTVCVAVQGTYPNRP